MADRSLSTSEPAIKRKKQRPREQHGMTDTPIYRIWAAILRRCTNPNTKDYPRYGGRGITVCERWAESFSAFYADMGDRPPGTQIDRIKNERGYEPGNCRWISCSGNNRNRRDSVYVEFRGERLHIQELAERCGIGAHTLAWRMKRGMSPEEAGTANLADHNSYVEFRGERVSMAELSRRTGLDRETIRARMTRGGMNLEEAATLPLKRQPFVVSYNGQAMRLFELAKLTGIDPMTLKYRIRSKGMTAEQAVTTPIARKQGM